MIGHIAKTAQYNWSALQEFGKNKMEFVEKKHNVYEEYAEESSLNYYYYIVFVFVAYDADKPYLY